MTNERPIEDARCWLINASEISIDVYVNYDDSPYLSIAPTEDGPQYSIDSDAGGVFGAYTFQVREEGDTDDPPLAEASVQMEEHDSYSAVFHRVGEAEYELSIYENEFESSAATQFQIRHVAVPEPIDWSIAPKPEADPSIPVDERSGTLEHGQWQKAYDVTENEYRLEVEHDGEVVAFRQDLELELNRMIVVYVVRDPKWWMGSDQKEAHVLRQEYQIPTGEANPDMVTQPMSPYTQTDTNEPVTFDCGPIEQFETNHTTAEIAATDPDGIVSGLEISEVTPPSDGFLIPDETVDRASWFGHPTTGTLEVLPKVPPGEYEVEVVANGQSMGTTTTCVVDATVKEITTGRLHDLVDAYHDDGEMTDAIAADLHQYLDEATVHLSNGEVTEACADLKSAVTLVGEKKGEGITETATVDIETETGALRERLDCG